MRTLCQKKVLEQVVSQKVGTCEHLLGQRPAAGKSVKPRMLNFAPSLALMLNPWQGCCGTEKGNEQGIVSNVEPGFFDNAGIL